MSRGLSSANLAAIAAGTIYPIHFASLDFASGTAYVCNAFGPVVWNSQTWKGLGEFAGVGNVRESSALQANNLVLVLNGVDPTLIASTLGTRSRGRNCTIYKGFFNAAGVLQVDPFIVFSGRMEQPVIANNGDNCSISVTVESRLADFQKAREIRYTDAVQQSLSPGDTGLQYVAALQNKDIVWGPVSSTASAPSTGGNTGGGNNGHPINNSQPN